LNDSLNAFLEIDRNGALSRAEAPFVVAWSNEILERFGSAANPVLVPISSGVSSIHSAVACVEEYGTVFVKVSLRVTSRSVIFQTFEPETVSEIWACM